MAAPFAWADEPEPAGQAGGGNPGGGDDNGDGHVPQPAAEARSFTGVAAGRTRRVLFVLKTCSARQPEAIAKQTEKILKEAPREMVKDLVTVREDGAVQG